MELLFPAAWEELSQETDAKEDQPLESPVLGAHRAQKMRAGFPYGEYLSPNPGLHGTSLQPGVTCKVLPVKT